MNCPNCGAMMVRTSDKILTSNPPKYELQCPKCGAIKYELVHQIDTLGFEGVHSSFITLPDPWQNFRCNAAKDFLAASIQHYGLCGNPKDDNHISRAIQYADELIKQLKERDEHNNSK